eukprot:2505049-Pleurochrysis_carterae.AAC.2
MDGDVGHSNVICAGVSLIFESYCAHRSITNDEFLSVLKAVLCSHRCLTQDTADLLGLTCFAGDCDA